MKVERSGPHDTNRSTLRRRAVCLAGGLLVLAAVLAVLIFPLNRIHYGLDWMDSGNVRDESLTDPNYLVSKRFPSPNAQQRNQPIVIVVHGFSASTFEWSEFKAYADNPERNILVSQVLLGGHGRSLEDFRRSTWQDWQDPILREYNALVAQGYSHISLMGSSLGGTLIMDLVARHRFDQHPPQHIILVCATVEPANKMLHWANVVTLFVNAVPRKPISSLDAAHWYLNRPAESLRELKRFLDVFREELNGGITLPAKTTLRIYQSERDGTVDPVSGQLFRNGVQSLGGSSVELVPVDSAKHVFTQLRIYPASEISASDRALQSKTFAEIVDIVSH